MKCFGATGGFCGKFCELLQPGGENNGDHTVAVITELSSPSPVIISCVYQGLRRVLCNMTRDSSGEGGWEGLGVCCGFQGLGARL